MKIPSTDVIELNGKKYVQEKYCQEMIEITINIKRNKK